MGRTVHLVAMEGEHATSEVCHEETTDDDGMLGPCDAPMFGFRIDPEEGGRYPVCRQHYRPPLTERGDNMSIDVDAIRARVAAAKPGPWRAALMNGVHHDDGSSSYRGGIYPGGASGPPPILVTNSIDKYNADLIARAPTDIAALLAEVERLRAVELEHTEDCGRFVECGTDGRTCSHAETLIDAENTQRCVWCLVDRLRKVAEAAEEVIAGRGDRSMKHLGAHEQLVAALDAWRAEQ